MTYENLTVSQIIATINSINNLYRAAKPAKPILDALEILESVASSRIDLEEEIYYDRLEFEKFDKSIQAEFDISNNFYEEDVDEFEWHDNPNVYEPVLDDTVRLLLDLYPRESLNDMMLDLMSGIDRVFYSFNGVPLLLSEEAEFITMSAISLLESRLKR